MELFQTEQSAHKHSRVEGERLGISPPGRAMFAVSAHARHVLLEIERLAAVEGLSTASSGKAIGEAFSVLRSLVFDRMLDREKSYRGTLIGIYHGVDVVRLTRAAAGAHRRDAIVAFCDAWLAQRIPLVEVAARSLDWFGANPTLAVQSATDPLERSWA